MEMHDLHWNGQKKNTTDLLQKTFLSERKKTIGSHALIVYTATK